MIDRYAIGNESARVKWGLGAFLGKLPDAIALGSDIVGGASSIAGCSGAEVRFVGSSVSEGPCATPIPSPRTDWTSPRKHALVSVTAGTGRARPETLGSPRDTRGFGWWHR